MWEFAELNPESTLMMITHGLFQDLLLKVLLFSTSPTENSFYRNENNPYFNSGRRCGNSTVEEDGQNPKQQLPYFLIDVLRRINENNEMVKHNDATNQCTTQDQQRQQQPDHQVHQTTLPTKSISHQNSPQPLVHSSPFGINSKTNGNNINIHPYGSEKNLFFLCNNVGVSLLELFVINQKDDKCEGEDDNVEQNPKRMKNENNNLDYQQVQNKEQEQLLSSPPGDDKRILSVGKSNEIYEAPNYYEASDEVNCSNDNKNSRNVSSCCSCSVNCNSNSENTNDRKSYECAILFWNIHSFLSGKELLASGHSIGKFSVF